MSHRFRHLRHPLAVSGLLGVSVFAPHALKAQEFVRQQVLVVPFVSDSAAGENARNVARDIADAVRDRLGDRLNKREAEVLGAYHLNLLLKQSDYARSTVLNDTELRLVATKLRADETITGTVVREGGQWVVRARLARLRNWHIAQPLPVVRGISARAAGEAVVSEVLRARAQLIPLRRCENALAGGDRATAAREAERAVRAYGDATIARSCLITALLDGRTGADSVLQVADAVLARDSANVIANVARAQALETLGRRLPAASQWARVYTTHGDSVPVGIIAVEGLLRMGQAQESLDNARTLLRRTGPNASLRRLSFRAHASLGNWKDAAIIGDSLENEDEVFRTDSSYATRYVESLRQTHDSLASLELVVRNVRRFPGDARLYLQYVQILNGEQTVALPRALARFPSAPEFPLLVASNARRSGNRGEAIRATREALRRDSALFQPYLALAEYYLEEHAVDSAVSVLRRAPRTADAAEMLRSYAIARGLGLLRSSGDSVRREQEAGVALVVLADTIASRADSRAYVAAASLQLARNHLVVASRTRSCADLEQSETTLQLAAQAIDSGLGSDQNVSEIVTAFEEMRKAVEQARPILCKSGIDNDSGQTVIRGTSGAASTGSSPSTRGSGATSMARPTAVNPARR